MRHPADYFRTHIRVAHGNIHNELSGVNFARNARVDLVGLNEANRRIGDLEKLPRFHAYYKGHARGNGDTVTLVRKRYPVDKVIHLQVSKELPGVSRVAPDRWLTGVWFQHPLGPVAHFNLHADAGPKQLFGNDEAAPIVQQYAKSMEDTRNEILKAAGHGYMIILTGDLNYGPRLDRPWSPINMLVKPLGMGLDYHAVGLDWVMWSHELHLDSCNTVKLYDHPGLLPVFSRKKRR